MLKVLVIGQPDDSISNLQKEIENIRRRRHLKEARRDNVLCSLRQHFWAHFSCYGYFGYYAQPFQAGFQLHGGDDLTLLDLTQARLPVVELAFLSGHSKSQRRTESQPLLLNTRAKTVTS